MFLWHLWGWFRPNKHSEKCWSLTCFNHQSLLCFNTFGDRNTGSNSCSLRDATLSQTKCIVKNKLLNQWLNRRELTCHFWFHHLYPQQLSTCGTSVLFPCKYTAKYCLWWYWSLRNMGRSDEILNWMKEFTRKWLHFCQILSLLLFEDKISCKWLLAK